MIAYLPLDWIVDENSEDFSLPARFLRELEIKTLKKEFRPVACNTVVCALSESALFCSPLVLLEK
jgi:CRISPR/Cas system type I-B associated protein Csh2 (Cas7 group RAMP superfamily)